VKIMEMMERYLYDIGRRLPSKQREDIVKELRSLLQDALDARTEGREPTEADVAAVLSEFGSPAAVASRYAGERYLIGPGMFDLYWLVLRIVVASMAFGLAVALVVGLVFDTTSGFDAFRRVLSFIPEVFTAALTAFGYVTAIFFLIERFGKQKDFRDTLKQRDWNPADLPQVPIRTDRVGRVGPLFAICFTLLALGILNFHPEWIVFVHTLNPGADIVYIPVLAPAALAAYLPLWNVGLVSGLVVQFLLLQSGRWNLGTRLGEIGRQLFSIGVLAYMMVGPALLAPDVFSDFPELPDLAELNGLFTMNFRWVFGLLIFFVVVDIVKTAVQAVRSKLAKT
jgi:hypothetical protein